MRPSTGASPGPKCRYPPFPRRQAPPSSRSPSADQTARGLGGQTFRHRLSCCPSSAVGGTPHRGLDCAEKKPSSMPPFPTRRGNWACLWIAGIQSLERRKPKIRTTVSLKLVVVPCSVQDLSSGSAFCRRAPSSHPLIMAVCHEMGRGQSLACRSPRRRHSSAVLEISRHDRRASPSAIPPNQASQALDMSRRHSLHHHPPSHPHQHHNAGLLPPRRRAPPSQPSGTHPRLSVRPRRISAGR